MAGEAILSQGTVLRIMTDQGPPEVFIALDKVVSWPGFGDRRDFEDVTHLGSTATEKLARLPVSGSSSLSVIAEKGATGILWAPGQEAFQSAYVSGEKQVFEVEFPAESGGQVYRREGYVSAFDPVSETNSAVRITIEIEWTGSWTVS